MICEKCGKNEATIHYTEVINGVKSEHYLCGECAKNTDMGYYSGIFEGEFPLADLIKGILSTGGMLSRREQAEKKDILTCPKCNMTYDEFIKEGKFGCSECYNLFGPLIVEELKKIQGNFGNKGKKYKKNKLKNNESIEKKEKVYDIDELTKQLKYAVSIEEFDEAARLRDEIKRLRQGENNNA